MSRLNFGYRKKQWNWQLIALITLAAAVSGAAASLILTKRPLEQIISAPTAQKTQEKKANPVSLPNGKALVAESDGAFRNLIGQLEQQVKDARLTFSVPAQFQGQTFKKVKLNTQDKVIALTFDDGPWPGSTEKILDILKKEKIKATFFMVGAPLQDFPQIAKSVVQEGHAIGNHTWNHWYHHLSPEVAASEIDRTAALLYKTTGVKTSLFRPPGGVLNNGVADYTIKQKYSVVMWSSDSNDYQRPAVPKLVSNVLRDADSGGIVLMHDGGGNRDQTVAALPEIIADLKKQGYKFVTLPELLKMAAPNQEIDDKELGGGKSSQLPVTNPSP